MSEAGLYIPGYQSDCFFFLFLCQKKILGGKGTYSRLLLLLGRIKVSLVTEKHSTRSINYIKGSYEAGQMQDSCPSGLFREGRPVSPTILE